jgi:3-oxosteroid 1-dehydrogenase
MRTDGPDFENLPAWAVFDQQFRQSYVVGTTMPEDPDPAHLLRSDTLEGLAALAGIDSAGLVATVARWNGFVAAGKDADFGKGASAFDRYQGDRKTPNPNLGSIATGPFYALPLHPGTLGTKGGPRTDEHARVLDVRGQCIGGLYAAGNVAASITGPSYYGVGSTLGPAMTWGFIAGQHVATAGKSA